MTTAIRPATRNHDDATSTSLPATVPILNVPGARTGRSASGTPRGYPTGQVGRRVAAGGCRRAHLGWRRGCAAGVSDRGLLDAGRRGRGRRGPVAEQGERLHG